MKTTSSFYLEFPQFVLELLGTAKERSDIKEKMEKYMNSGVDLGWVVDPVNKSVTIYRRKPGGGYEVRSFVATFRLTRSCLGRR